jgi:hypothetical protein
MTLKLKLNTALKGFPCGHILELPAENGMPLDGFWARRLKDSVLDNCVEVIVDKPSPVSDGETKRKGDRKWDK